jgi:2-oxoglutarate ferredoxin oxidoreductase subunit gamma
MKKSDLQLMIAGFGGQGILFAGKLLAQSAMLEYKQVTWFPSYGAEIRGGTANCTVIVSEEMIGSPAVLSPNSLLIMNKASMEKFESRLIPGGLLIMNTSLIKDPVKRSDVEIIKIRATDIAKDLGNSQVANIVMLGALIGKTGVVSPDTVTSAIEQIVPEHKKKIIPLNKSAFMKGISEIDN